MMTEPDLLQDFRRSVEAFAREQLAPGARERAHSPHYPKETARLLARQGLLGLSIPEELGGQGAGLVAAVAAIQAVATGCPRSADIVQAGNFGPIRTFAQYATAEQRQRYLPGLLAGEQIIALGMSEPEAGSAVTELTTTATRHGHGYLRQRHQGLLHAQCRRRRVPGVPAVRARDRRHRLGADRPRPPGTGRRSAVAFHERRALVPALLR